MGNNGIYREGYKMLGKLNITLPYKVTKSNTSITYVYPSSLWQTTIKKTRQKQKKH